MNIPEEAKLTDDELVDKFLAGKGEGITFRHIADAASEKAFKAGRRDTINEIFQKIEDIESWQVISKKHHYTHLHLPVGKYTKLKSFYLKELEAEGKHE